MMASPQYLRHLQHHHRLSHDSPTTHLPNVGSPTFTKNGYKPPSPINSVSGDFEHHVLERLAASQQDISDPSAHVQHYPIRSRRPGYDPLAIGLRKISQGLSETILPILSIPMPKGPDNIGNPHCRGYTGIGGSMISTAPIENVYMALQNAKSDDTEEQGQDQQAPIESPVQLVNQKGRVQPQTMPSQHPQYAYQTPTFTPSPPGSRSPTDTMKQAPTSSAAAPPRSEPSPAPSAPKRPKKEPQEEFKTEFRFVVNEDAKTARNTVRQHVMREFRRRERWEQGKNKVSKAKKSKKETKDSKDASKKQDDQPAMEQEQQQLPSQSQPEQQERDLTPQSQSFQSFTSQTAASLDGSVPAAPVPGNGRRNSQATSTSSTDGSSSDGDKFAALIRAGTLNHRKDHPSIQPFAQYAENGIGLRPEDVEDAVEEIERSQLSYYPYQHDPWAEIARAEINPFSQQVTVGAGPASRALLHHYAWVMPSLMDEIVTGNVFHRIGWLYSAVAIHDPTPYHTIMGFTLGHVAMLRGMEEPPLATQHKEKSLKLIHSRLADPLLAASDGSIGAVANIAAYELIDCRPERFAIHMQGLSRLVTQRGGMSDFVFNTELETVLIRLDVIRAYVTISAPRFPSWAAVRKLTPLAINIGPPITDWFCLPADCHRHAYLYSEDAIRLIHNVEDIMLLMRSVHPTIPFTPDPSFKTLLMESILGHLRRDMLDTPATFSGHVSRRAIRLAAIVLFDIAASEFFNPPGSGFSSTGTQPQAGAPLYSPMTTVSPPKPGEPIPERAPGSARPPSDKKGLGQHRLKARFPSIEDYRHQWGRSVEMIAAVLMQAERMALERPFRAWYVADIVTLTMKLGDTEWMIIEELLKADFANRIVEERLLKEQRQLAGIQDDGIWDLEELLTRFWAEWHETYSSASSFSGDY